MRNRPKSGVSKLSKHEVANRILGILEKDGPSKTMQLVARIASEDIKDFLVKAELLRLERLGLLQREVLDDRDPLNNSTWALAERGRLMLTESGKEPYSSVVQQAEAESIQEDIRKSVEVVTTCPREYRDRFSRLDSKDSVDVVRSLFESASHEVKIVSPYVDNVLIDRFENELERMSKDRVRLKLLFRDYNPQTQNVVHALRLIFGDNFEFRRIFTPIGPGGRGQSIRGIHAKFMILDKKIVLLSSMNFTVNSMNYNIETGLLVSIARVVEQLDEIFSILWTNAAHPT